MADVKPFNGIRYNKGKVTLEKAVAPPYDVITRQERDRLHELDKHNCVRLILAKESPQDTSSDNKYTRSKKALDEMLEQKVLLCDKTPSLYLYEQRYSFRSMQLSRTGFFALLKIEEHGERSVYPHEVTLPKAKVDRMNLLREVNANLSPVFMFYADTDQAITSVIEDVKRSQEPEASFAYDGIENSVWHIEDKDVCEAVVKGMSAKEVFIADGHHRYEVALNYRNETLKGNADAALKEGCQYVMCYFAAVSDEAWSILPIHRLVSGIHPSRMPSIMHDLEKLFVVTPLKSKEEMLKRLDEVLRKKCAFGLYTKKGYFFLELRDDARAQEVFDWYQVTSCLRELDVTHLHTLVFKKILGMGTGGASALQVTYIKSDDKAIRLVDKGKQQLAFFLNPPQVAHVRNVARSGEKMPPKSTYFYPKPLTGLVMNPFVPPCS